MQAQEHMERQCYLPASRLWLIGFQATWVVGRIALGVKSRRAKSEGVPGPSPVTVTAPDGWPTATMCSGVSSGYQSTTVEPSCVLAAAQLRPPPVPPSPLAGWLLQINSHDGYGKASTREEMGEVEKQG